MKLSAEELANKRLNPETVESAVEQVRLNGYVLFEGVLESELVDQMHSSFMNALNDATNRDPNSTEVNTTEFRKNRVRMDLPFEEPFIDPSIITSPFVLPIIEKLVGEDCACIYLSADAPLPGSDYQVVHSDQMPFFPESTISLPPAGIVLNIPLVDVTEENGPMEAFPGGNHLMPENKNTPRYIEEAASFLKPVRMTMPRGSLLIRDLRMWHRGTPNKSDHVRPNVALIYARPWWKGGYQESLNISREKFEGLSDRAKRLFRFEKLKDNLEQPIR
ncbi:phytanoyl-CoA dioxygenase family protein [Paenibacillus frigoriresistens]|uniref:phytanoyl-CoA dioxygenase family protein n=1 Tax=Paenibacillus alginolyticus TaxID=59839 RepID=UPI001563A03D|nr:phytanoyl-CoA dioxygenase family protein [Paenibacillus frigoriresistens]NRF90367.1 phytanoyl-CoA dioxygenase family protein [Paenibacillus frigoriresistens]